MGLHKKAKALKIDGNDLIALGFKGQRIGETLETCLKAIIDGKVAFSGGINIADEYINAKKRFGHWKDTAVCLRGNAVKSLAALFLQNYDEESCINGSFGLLDASEFMKEFMKIK